MRRALVLNATFEPLSIVSSRRAVCLLIEEKAELIEADDGVVRSASITMAVPAVIRLRYMVRAPRRRMAAVSRRRGVRTRRLSLPILRQPGRLDRPCGPAVAGRTRRLGQSGGGLSTVQQRQAGSNARRGRHAPDPPVQCPSRDSLDRGGVDDRARHLEAVPADRQLTAACDQPDRDPGRRAAR